MSVLHGDEQSASRSCRFTFGDRCLNNYWIRGWKVSRADLYLVKKKKKEKFLSPPGIESQLSSLHTIKAKNNMFINTAKSCPYIL
jgi:hypothetical protein